MKVSVISEQGYNQAVLGFSLSYNSTIERTKQILSKYAFGVPGESKFLEQIILWVDVTAPRFFWSEADTYRVGTSKQSESTMHTITKRRLTNADFEYALEEEYLWWVNNQINWYNDKESDGDARKAYFLSIKNMLPEGFLQRRIWMFSYRTLQGIYIQRYNHKLPQWRYFLDTVLSQIEHPEFIVEKSKEKTMK